ncbi:MAG: ATPase with chaperone activity [Betaproteobacteria bacterium]|nr:ATPase with chaperone activity [Betaproteobacteria bacterium]
MDESSQRQVPEAFIRLYVPPGRIKPTLSWAELLERHELCEDLAQMLGEPARAQLHELGLAEADVLGRIRAGLPATNLDLTVGEIGWVLGRLAETLGWFDDNGQPLVID